MIGDVLAWVAWAIAVSAGVWVIDGLRTRRLMVSTFEAYGIPLVQRCRCRSEKTVTTGGRTWVESEEYWRGFALRLPGHRALFVGRRES